MQKTFGVACSKSIFKFLGIDASWETIEEELSEGRCETERGKGR